MEELKKPKMTYDELEARLIDARRVIVIQQKEIEKLKDEKLKLSKRLHPRHGDIIMISAEVWQAFMSRHHIHTNDAVFEMQMDMLIREK